MHTGKMVIFILTQILILIWTLYLKNCWPFVKLWSNLSYASSLHLSKEITKNWNIPVFLTKFHKFFNDVPIFSNIWNKNTKQCYMNNVSTFINGNRKCKKKYALFLSCNFKFSEISIIHLAMVFLNNDISENNCYFSRLKNFWSLRHVVFFKTNSPSEKNFYEAATLFAIMELALTF